MVDGFPEKKRNLFVLKKEAFFFIALSFDETTNLLIAIKRRSSTLQILIYLYKS